MVEFVLLLEFTCFILWVKSVTIMAFEKASHKNMWDGVRRGAKYLLYICVPQILSVSSMAVIVFNTGDLSVP